MSMVSVAFRVTSVRSRGKLGGAIFSGINSDGRHFVAVCSYKVLPDATLVDMGQHWSIAGTLKARGEEQQIEVVTALLMRPSGRNIIDWIVNSPDCAGIGRVKADDLYKAFGPDLVERIHQRDMSALTTVVTEKAAHILCQAFDKYKISSTLLWLDHLAIDRKIGKKIVEFYEDEAQQKIEENPYRLISFAAKWSDVDNLACQRFGFAVDDPRRLDAAVEQVLYAGTTNGHTCLPISYVKASLSALLRDPDLAKKALKLEGESPQYRRIGDQLQPTGMMVIEKYIADRLRAIASNKDDGRQQSLCLSKDHHLETDESAMAAYEKEQGFPLATEQRDAIITSARSNLSLIVGGAGTGKTTVLKALYKALSTHQKGIVIHQVALAGRAAQRMSEATDRESMTIAAFLKKVDVNMLGHGAVVVVDEMSMVDVILMYRLLRHIPPGTKLILVGDPSQLPPIGPGLVLHALVGHPLIPQTTLKVTQRQIAESGIPAIAWAVREHRLPEFAEYRGKGRGVSFVPCKDIDIDATVQRVYEELGGAGIDYSVQVLSITKGEKFGGTKSINAAFSNAYRQDSQIVFIHNPVFGPVGCTTQERISLRVGDLVMYTQNDYQLGLRNGSLGIVIKAIAPIYSTDDPCCVCEFEGVRLQLNTKQVEALRHAYSITIHKSQGSQFNRVIIPIRRSRMLDQALIYTGITRGIEQVVLVGDMDAAFAAIKAPASATLRHVSLPHLLNRKSINPYESDEEESP
ncbi:AAA family ATPase [Noviherbaspirillum sp.]|uniref:AAA family ATPase n=1 Tax=Noviherbaspirillum sp. TaxID=1926288 RepID=UPI002FE2ED05